MGQNAQRVGLPQDDMMTCLYCVTFDLNHSGPQASLALIFRLNIDWICIVTREGSVVALPTQVCTLASFLSVI